MNKTDIYRKSLKDLQDWDEYLLRESGLPGPRGNLELAQVVADEGDLALFDRYLLFDSQRAPTNSPYEFLSFCGVVGLGRLAAEGKLDLIERLRLFASDPRWRVREGVAMALQRLGEKDMDLLIGIAGDWATGNQYEQRAAVAALAEPKLLEDARYAEPILAIFDRTTASVQASTDRKAGEFQALRKGLGYGWSVIVAAFPEPGMVRMEQWFSSHDPDVLWIMNENLKKKRLSRAAPEWVERWSKALSEIRVQLGGYGTK